MINRPNILVIMSDEHDAANMGCYGDMLVATPTLDALADQGVTFDHCYCNSPLCAPSRLSFTSGQYISRCGAWGNGCWLPSDDYPSLPHVMNHAGYRSYLCGKQHYDATRRYGFTDLLPLMRENDRHKTGREKRQLVDGQINRVAWAHRSADFHADNDSIVLNHDRLVTQRAMEFLSHQAKQDQPFFLFAGYLAPHFPMIVPQAYADRFAGRVPSPRIPEGVLEKLPTNYQVLRRAFGCVDVDPEVVQRGRDLYWALTAWFDNQVAHLLGGLADSDFADNTIVIYTSDHGENKGDHGLWWKNCMYDHGARVPLIVSWPKRWVGGQRRTSVCSLVDLVKTIIDLGDGDVPQQMDGDAMTDYLDDETVGFKDFALSEYYGHNIASGITMVRAGQWKYVYHSRIDEAHGPERELYNMTSDPHELSNLAQQPEHLDRIAQMHRAMTGELGEDPEEIEQRCRADYALGYGR